MKKNKIAPPLLIAIGIVCLLLSVNPLSIANVLIQPKVAPAKTVEPSPIQVVLSEPASSYCQRLAEGVFMLHSPKLGCPSTGHPRAMPIAWQVEIVYQPFERGVMLWSSKNSCCNPPRIYVFYEDGSYQSFQSDHTKKEDFNTLNPFSGSGSPPNNLFKPVQGFRDIWQEEIGVRDALGWAIAKETYSNGRFQAFSQGSMIWIEHSKEIYSLNGEKYDVVNEPNFTLPVQSQPDNMAELILNSWVEYSSPEEQSPLTFLSDGTFTFGGCTGHYELLGNHKIQIDSSDCINPQLPTAMYEYLFDSAAQRLLLSQRYTLETQGYSEKEWRQDDNNYVIQLSPAGINILGEDQCYGTIDTAANGMITIEWPDCENTAKSVPNAHYKFTYVGHELFLTRQFDAG